METYEIVLSKMLLKCFPESQHNIVTLLLTNSTAEEEIKHISLFQQP